MTFLLISFVAGVLTVLAPCVLPLLPVIVGGSVADVRSRWKPYVITASLAVSVVAFTLLLKVSTYFIDIPQVFWQYFSGAILIFFGLITLFPNIWEKGALKLNLIISRKSNTALAEGVKKESFLGDIIIGASLGPVFSSCSPTYFIILATVLPQSFALGIIDLIAYAVGLSLALLCVALIGQKLVGRLDGVSDPHGWFKRLLGAIFLLVGILVLTGSMARIEAYLISKFDVTGIETSIKKYLIPEEGLAPLNQPSEGTSTVDVVDMIPATGINQTSNGEVGTKVSVKPTSPIAAKPLVSIAAKTQLYPKFVEIANPSGFVNSKPFKMADLIGKKVILLDFMTYSCINCQRTFPYLTAWYKKYKDMGLEIVAIHTPEFAFEKKLENVQAAFKQYGLTFPAVLDNDYGTWNAYQNNYWPHKYLIDIDGYIVYDHIGEGKYDETESKIKELLAERAQKLGEKVATNGNISATIAETKIDAQSQETYFGAFRNAEFFGNGEGKKVYESDFTLPSTFAFNKFYLGGKWSIQDQYIESEDTSYVAFSYNATKVHLVAEAPDGAMIQVQNGEGANVSAIDIGAATLYTIITNKDRQSSTLHIKVPKGVRIYALTFG